MYFHAYFLTASFFISAGADVIITNTYQASIGGFEKHLKLNEAASYDLIKSAVHLAKTASNRFLEEFPNNSKNYFMIIYYYLHDKPYFT